MAKKPIATLTEAQLRRLIGQRKPEIAALMNTAVTKMRKLLPGTAEFVYDKKNSIVVGFCSGKRATSVINSLATYTNWINLYFFEGDALPDPGGLLQGHGSIVRSIRLTDAAALDHPAIRALIAAAVQEAEPPLDRKAKRRIVLRQSTRRS